MAARNPRLAPDFAFVPGDEVYLALPAETPVRGIVRACIWQASGLTYRVLWPDMEFSHHPSAELCREGRYDYGVTKPDTEDD